MCKNFGIHINVNKEIFPTFNSFIISNLMPGFNDLFLRKSCSFLIIFKFYADIFFSMEYIRLKNFNFELLYKKKYLKTMYK